MRDTVRAADAAQELAAIASAMHKRMRVCHQEVRLEILARLIGGSMDVGTLAAAVSLDMPTISRNLAALKAMGLVVSRIDLTRRIYSLSEAVRVELREGRYELRLNIPGGALVAFGFPVERIHCFHQDADDSRMARLDPQASSAIGIGILSDGSTERI